MDSTQEGGMPVADLTTVDGLQFHFDPGAVTAVADHDADTLQAVTTVYGLMDGRLRLAEVLTGPLGVADEVLAERYRSTLK